MDNEKDKRYTRLYNYVKFGRYRLIVTIFPLIIEIN